jgi:predicted AAA+ superfamily ATPase
MIDRRVTCQIRQDLAEVPAVLLVGARQVGKTTLARVIAGSLAGGSQYLDLGRPGDRARLSDPDAYLRGHENRLLVIDEVQRAPGIFEVIRGVIDERRAAGNRVGHFLLLGSASLELVQQSAETLAGRVRYRELDPVDPTEIPGRDLDRLWVRGGFPESFLSRTDRLSLAWRDDFVRSYLERDVPMFAPRLPAQTVGRLWTMLAHQQGSVLNSSRLAAGLAVSQGAIGRYLDLLTDLLLVRQLQPWSGNVGKRLVRSPKVYVRDSGLVHALLGISDLEALLGHPVVGPSYEGFVLESLLSIAPSGYRASFFRTQAGAEVDLVLERGADVQAVVEIKRSLAPVPSRGFHLAAADLSAHHQFVVYPGTETFALGSNVIAIPLDELMRRLELGDLGAS